MNNVIVSLNIADVISKYKAELLVMHPDDLDLVLGIILPLGSDIELHKEEIIKWQKKNQDTMKK